jgi:quercetin dioxygenase-like cupin family protein
VSAVPEVIPEPARIPVPGGKVIDEYVGRVATPGAALSVARMSAPAGWTEPGQTPEFDEVTLVLSGSVVVEHAGGAVEVRAGQAVVTRAGEWVRYAAGPDGAEYVAVCTPAFSPELAHRDEASRDEAFRDEPEQGGHAGNADPLLRHSSD